MLSGGRLCPVERNSHMTPRRSLGTGLPFEPRPLDYSNGRRRVWEPAVEAAGLLGLGFRDLRRTNATALVLEGVDVKTAQARLGHSDPRLTLAIASDQRGRPVGGREARCPADGTNRRRAGQIRVGQLVVGRSEDHRSPRAATNS
jgi:hypothetical protein